MKKVLTISVFAACLVSFASCGSSGEGGGESFYGPQCGNGKIESGEVCDGDVTCGEAGHFWPEGKATCNSDCSAYDTSKCVARDPSDKCGNGQIDSGESCEQGDTKPCSELSDNFTQGDAKCKRDCRGWNPEDCSNGGKVKPCSLIFECVRKCADSSCEADCKAAGTDQGAALYADLETCAAACGGVTDEDCLINNCYNEYYTCNPSKKCGNKVLDEGELCEKKDTKPCQELNTDSKQYQPVNEAVCNSSCTGWDTFSCVDINALTCYQVFECVQECSDSECEAACVSKTWAEAKSIYDTMMACLDKNCPVITDECMNEFCKFQTDSCKTHLTCGNGIVDKQYEVCDTKDENAGFIDCGEIKDEKGESMYEAGTGTAFCGPKCTTFETDLCYRFCSCAEVQKCIEQECGGYPKSNAENTDEKIACMETCESWGTYVGKGDTAGYRRYMEACYDDNGATAWDSDACRQQLSSDCSDTDTNDPRCPY